MLFNKKTVRDVELKNKRVLMRVDFNVPIYKNNILDDIRIRSTIPTIKYVLDKDASIILLSHLGRPSGINRDYSLKPIGIRLRELLPDTNVIIMDDCVGPEVLKCAKKLKPGEIMLCENTRFYKQEGMRPYGSGERIEQNNFAKMLAKLGDVYVNDAFGTIHRSHASIMLTCKYIKHSVAGLLMEKEIDNLQYIISNIKELFVVIVGGAKISDKIWAIKKLVPKVNYMLIGGGIAYTFLKAQGYNIGKSICDDSVVNVAKDIIDSAKFYNTKIFLPIDHVVVKDTDADNFEIINTRDISDGHIGMDIGPQTVAFYGDIISYASTVIWNGPMGFFEKPNFSQGTSQIAKMLAESNAVSVVSGGDSIAALQKNKSLDYITHVSTGGGSVLDFLSEDGILPGLIVLEDK